MKFNLVFLILTFALTVSAQVTGSDSIQIGKPGSAANKEIKFGAGRGNKPAIRYNTTNSKLEFSNDASIYKALGSGSGSGSGINLLTNPGFEDGVLSAWTNTGGTYAAASGAANILYELIGAAFTPSATGQFFESTAIVVPEILKGQRCMVKIAYKGADANVFLSVFDGTSTELIPTTARAALVPATLKNDAKLYFDCPSSGSIKLRVQSTAAGVIGYYDQAHLGQSDEIGYKQSQMFGTARWPQAVACAWPITGSGIGLIGSFLTPVVDNDCSNPVVTGNAIAPPTKVPKIRFANAPPGTYKVTINGNFQVDATGSVLSIADSLGNIGSSRSGVLTGAGALNSNVAVSVFKYTSSQSNLEFFPVANAISGSPTTSINNSENTQNETDYEIIVEYYPLEAEVAVNSKCLNPVDCENSFGALMASNGTISGENLDWLNGNCTNPSTGTYSCPVKAGIFNSTPNCTLTSYSGTDTAAAGTSISSSTVNFTTFSTNNGVLGNAFVFISCQRGSDFKPRQDIKGWFSSMLSPVSFYAYSTSGQSIPSGVDATVIMNVEGYDTNNAYDPTTGTFTVPETGKYQCYCMFTYASANFGVSTLQPGIQVNGSLLASKFYTTAAVVNPQSIDINSSNAYNLGDQIRCIAFQNTGISRGLSTTGPYSTFTCNKVGN